jgi:hypothetical protein
MPTSGLRKPAKTATTSTAVIPRRRVLGSGIAVMTSEIA